jgi:hypothetical protein
MLQKGLLGRPDASRDMMSVPDAIKAVASVSPSYADTAVPFTTMSMGAGLATLFVIR